MPEVHSITAAGRSHSEQSRERIRHYLITMGIRTACFAAAIFVHVGWLRLLFVAMAALLPIIAVLVANAGGDPRRGSAEYVDPEGLPAGDRPETPSSETSTSDSSNTQSGAQR